MIKGTLILSTYSCSKLFETPHFGDRRPSPVSPHDKII